MRSHKVELRTERRKKVIEDDVEKEVRTAFDVAYSRHTHTLWRSRPSNT